MSISALSTKNCAPPTGAMLIGLSPSVGPRVTPVSGAVSTRSVPSNRSGSAFHAAWHTFSRNWFDASSVQLGGGIWSCGPVQLLATAGYVDVEADVTTLIPAGPPSAA